MAQSIFTDGELLAKDRHADLRFRPDAGYASCAAQTTAPLTITEFMPAAMEFPILFAITAEGPVPVVIMGLRAGRNLFVAEDGNWTGDYIPAHFRQLPFFNTMVRDTGKVFLSILPEHAAFCDTGTGLRLFDEVGRTSVFLSRVMDFTRSHYQNTLKTRAFCNRLSQMNLLTPMTFAVEVPEQIPRKLHGFSMVDRKKLKALDDRQLAELERTGLLEAVHLHWGSIRNLERLAARTARRAAKAPLVWPPLVSVSSIARQISAPLH